MADVQSSLKALRKVTLHASVMRVDLPLPQWHRKDVHHTSDAFAKGLSRNSALEELCAVLPQHETHAAIGELAAAVTRMYKLNTLPVSQVGGMVNVLPQVHAMLSKPSYTLTKLRIDNDCIGPSNAGCIYGSVLLCKLLINLPALADISMQFRDLSGWSMAAQLSELPCGFQSLRSLELNANMEVRDGCPQLTQGILALCVPQNLRTLIESIDSGMRSPGIVQKCTEIVGTDQYLQRPLAAASFMQHLQIRHSHEHLHSTQILQDSLCGLTRLTLLSLDLCCAMSCAQHRFPKVSQLCNLQTLAYNVHA